jgi:hypothetical protein
MDRTNQEIEDDMYPEPWNETADRLIRKALGLLISYDSKTDDFTEIQLEFLRQIRHEWEEVCTSMTIDDAIRNMEEMRKLHGGQLPLKALIVRLEAE